MLIQVMALLAFCINMAYPLQQCNGPCAFMMCSITNKLLNHYKRIIVHSSCIIVVIKLYLHFTGHFFVFCFTVNNNIYIITFDATVAASAAADGNVIVL